MKRALLCIPAAAIALALSAIIFSPAAVADIVGGCGVGKACQVSSLTSVGNVSIPQGAKYNLNSVGGNSWITFDGTQVVFQSAGAQGMYLTGQDLHVANTTYSVGFSSNAASGANGLAFTTNGARFDFGSGASDYASSDGTTVTFAGPIASTTITASSNVVADGLKGAAVHNATTAQALEHGNSAFVAGTKTITFGTAFAAAPDCHCQDGTAVTSCDVPIASISTSQMVVNGTGTDTFMWFCMGAR